MVVENTTAYILIGIIAIYIMVYTKNKIIGSIFYIALAIATLSFATTTAEYAIGAIILGSSLVSSVYAILKPT